MPAKKRRGGVLGPEALKEQRDKDRLLGNPNTSPDSDSMKDLNAMNFKALIAMYIDFKLDHEAIQAKIISDLQELAQLEALKEEHALSEEETKRAQAYADSIKDQELKLITLAQQMAEQEKQLQQEVASLRTKIESLYTVIRDETRNMYNDIAKNSTHVTTMGIDLAKVIDKAHLVPGVDIANITVVLANKDIAKDLAVKMPDLLVDTKCTPDQIARIEAEQIKQFIYTKVRDKVVIYVKPDVDLNILDECINKVMQDPEIRRQHQEIVVYMQNDRKKSEANKVIAVAMGDARKCEKQMVVKVGLLEKCGVRLEENNVRLEESGARLDVNKAGVAVEKSESAEKASTLSETEGREQRNESMLEKRNRNAVIHVPPTREVKKSEELGKNATEAHRLFSHVENNSAQFFRGERTDEKVESTEESAKGEKPELVDAQQSQQEEHLQQKEAVPEDFDRLFSDGDQDEPKHEESDDTPTSPRISR